MFEYKGLYDLISKLANDYAAAYRQGFDAAFNLQNTAMEKFKSETAPLQYNIKKSIEDYFDSIKIDMTSVEDTEIPEILPALEITLKKFSCRFDFIPMAPSLRVLAKDDGKDMYVKSCMSCIHVSKIGCAKQCVRMGYYVDSDFLCKYYYCKEVGDK